MNAAAKDDYTDQEQDALRAEVRLLMEQEGLKQTEIAKEVGIAYGTFTPWMGGTYQGDANRIARNVANWLETRRERKKTLAILPESPSFVLTETAQNIFNILSFAQAAPDFGVVVGAPGIGKTKTILEYRKRSTNVFLVTGEPTLSSPYNLLSAIALEAGVEEKRNAMISRAIAARMRGASALIVVDEAQHLSNQAFDQLRALHDLSGCGIVAAGNESALRRLQGGQGPAGTQFAQLSSRVGMRLTQSRARSKDICAMLAAWSITNQAEATFLKSIAKKPGALRSLDKTLRLATMYARQAGKELGLEHMQLAWGQLSIAPVEAAA